MLQGARRLEGDLFALGVDAQCLQILLRQYFAQILSHGGDARGLLRIGSIVPQQQTVLLDHRTATAGRHHDGLYTRFHMRPPGIDIAAHEVQCLAVSGEMMTESAATTRILGPNQTDPKPIEDTRRRRIGRRADHGLYTTVQYQHLTGMPRLRPTGGGLPHRYLPA